jgi:isoleucyl-tRNA synthetase
LPNEGLAAKALDKTNGMVILDTNVTKELWEEGIVRDFVRFVQNGRKDAGLFITDKINIKISSKKEFVEIILKYSDFIKSQTLAESIVEQSQNLNGAFIKTEEIEENPITFGISKI